MKNVGLMVRLLAVALLGLTVQADSRVLRPLPQTGVKVGGFWGEQFRMLTVKWLPHCVRQMEKGGRGEEMLNLVATGELNAGKQPSVTFKGCMWSDAYPYNTVEAICLALEIDPGADAEWRTAQNAWRVGRVSFKFRKTGGRHGVMVWFFMGEGRRWPVCANLAGWFNAKNAFEAFDGYEADRSFHPGSFETGRWYDIAVTFKDSKMTALVDGKAVMETAVSCEALKLVSSCKVDPSTGELVVKLGNKGPRMRPVTLAFENEINPDAVKSAATVRVLDRKTIKVYVPAQSTIEVRLIEI